LDVERQRISSGNCIFGSYLMIRTPLSTVIGGAFWTPGATVIGGTSKKTFDQPIQSLFANNEQGFVYDPNDLSTMFQDAAGTIPVTAVGQPVGIILDKSGRNNHARQTTSASRPILRKNAITGANYLEFDGFDDYFVVLRDNLKFLHDGTGATGFVGFKPSGFTVYHALLSTGNLAITTSVGYALAQDDRFWNRLILNMVANGSGTMHVNNTYDSGIASANPYVVSFKNQISTHALRLSGAEVLNSSTESGAPNTSVSSYHLWIGRSPSGFAMHGNLYGMLCVNRLTTASETLAIEKELAKRAGVTL